LVSGQGRIIASALTLGLFVLAVAVQPLLEPSYDPLRQEISEFAHTGLGAIVLAGFLAWGTSLGLLAGLVVQAPSSASFHRAAQVESTVLGVAAFGLVLLTLFATDRGVEVAGAVTRHTVAGRLHDTGSALVTVSVLVAVVADAFRSRNTALASAVIAAAIASSAVLLACGDPLPGLRQRCLVACAVIWQAVVIDRLRRQLLTSV
jgi:hypothetical protein